MNPENREQGCMQAVPWEHPFWHLCNRMLQLQTQFVALVECIIEQLGNGKG